MNGFHDSPVSASIFCSSVEVPSVVVTMAWVSPRWNSAEPCTRGKSATSQVMGRMVRSSRPSMRTRCSTTILRTTTYFRSSNSSLTSFSTLGHFSSPSSALSFSASAFLSSP